MYSRSNFGINQEISGYETLLLKNYLPIKFWSTHIHFYHSITGSWKSWSEKLIMPYMQILNIKTNQMLYFTSHFSIPCQAPVIKALILKCGGQSPLTSLKCKEPFNQTFIMEFWSKKYKFSTKQFYLKQRQKCNQK